VDYLNARRVQTLIHLHGDERSNTEPSPDDPQLIDLDALAGEDQAKEERAKENNENVQADVA
jgi:hypothetical protein